MYNKTIKTKSSILKNQEKNITKQYLTPCITHKKFFIVMLFDSEHFIYDITTFISDFALLFMKFCKGGNISETAKGLSISRNTLTRLIFEHKPLSWDCYQVMLANLLKSDCPFPENDNIIICDDKTFANEYCTNRKNCKYYRFYKKCAHEFNSSKEL